LCSITSARKKQQTGESLALEKHTCGQISLSDFKQPMGMNLKENNRCVKKAQTIPWLAIEKRYAALFTKRKGNVEKPLRLALGACIIQT